MLHELQYPVASRTLVYDVEVNSCVANTQNKFEEIDSCHGSQTKI